MSDLLPAAALAPLVIRALVALFGLNVSWSGRRLAREQRAAIPTEASADPHVRRERLQRGNRMWMYSEVQTGCCYVHAMLLGNALVQIATGAPASYESLNVLTSNVIQVMIPLVLMRASELISAQMRAATDLQDVTGPREPTEGRP